MEVPQKSRSKYLRGKLKQSVKITVVFSTNAKNVVISWGGSKTDWANNCAVRGLRVPSDESGENCYSFPRQLIADNAVSNCSNR